MSWHFRCFGLLLACLVGLGLALASPGQVARADETAPTLDRPPGARSGDGGPSSVVFPPQAIPLRFSHSRHVGALGVGCSRCHPGARTSRRASDNLLPKGTGCDDCHHDEHARMPVVATDPNEPLGRCTLCHVGSDAAPQVVRLPKPNLRFDHAIHAARNIGCAQCHGSVEHVDRATRDGLPRMSGCMRCHGLSGPSRGRARGECRACHLERGGRLATTFGTGRLSPKTAFGNARHDPDFLRRHAAVAGTDSSLCANCHTERFCVDCHDGRLRPRTVHPGDWLSSHARAARLEAPRCTSCHRQQSSCITCHQRVGVAMNGPSALGSGRGRFHPPERVWTGLPRTRAHHAWEAQRNLSQCVSCHLERDCVACHATAARGGPGRGPGGRIGQGTNPHPPGFSAQCRGAMAKNARPCMVCHAPGDPALGRCAR
jgi:hypothetical protein